MPPDVTCGSITEEKNDDEDDDEDDDDDDEEGRDTTITSRGRGFPSVKKMFAALNNVWLTEFKMESPCWFNLAHDKNKKLQGSYSTKNSAVGFDISEHLSAIVLAMRNMSGWSTAQREQNSCMFLHRICHAMR